MSELKIDKLLSALDNEKNENLLNTNLNQISKEKNDILQKLFLNKETLKDYNNKLKKYRYIDEIDSLRSGEFFRWINIKDPNNLRLTNGAIFLDTKLLDNGLHLLFKNNYNKVFQIKMDECLIFQKLSNQELIILNVLKLLPNLE